MRRQLQLLVVEGHPVVSAGLARILNAEPDIAVLSEVPTCEDAMARLQRQHYDLILIDVRMRGHLTVQWFARLLATAKGVKILVFSAMQGDGDILRALKAGASGYLLKSASREEIVATVRRVAETDRYLPPEIAQKVAERIGKEDLTDRELQVLSLVREGRGNREIASRLRVAETTVNFHMKNTLCKLSANDRTHAVTIALRRGLL